MHSAVDTDDGGLVPESDKVTLVERIALETSVVAAEAITVLRHRSAGGRFSQQGSGTRQERALETGSVALAGSYPRHFFDKL